MPITGTGLIPFSSKGVSQGGSAARAAASKNGSLDEQRVRASRWMRASVRAFAMDLEALSCVIPGQIAVASRELDPRPSHCEPLRGDISGLFPFLNFFREGALKNFSGFSKRRFLLMASICVAVGRGSMPRVVE